MNPGTDQQARRAMAKIVEAHAWQPRALQECLEVLREPRPVDCVAAWRHEDSLLIALAVVVAILLLGRAPTVPDWSPSPSASQPTDGSPSSDDAPEAAVRAFFGAFAEARETDDPALIEPFVNGTDSSAYQTAAGFLVGQREVGKASVVTVNELSNFDVSSNGNEATVVFDHRLGGYDIDLESGEPVESPTVLETRRKQAVVVLVDGVWLVDSFENLP